MKALRLPPRIEEVIIAVYGAGMREVDVAQKLGISKQAVSKFVREGRARLAEIFLTISEILNADVVKVSLTRGYAVIKLRQLGTKGYIIYVPGKGPRVVFNHELKCSGGSELLCSEVVAAAEKWGIIERSEKSDLEEILKKILDVMES